jgi:hypothetical protein
MRDAVLPLWPFMADQTYEQENLRFGMNQEELARQLNNNMVDLLRQGGHIRSPGVEKLSGTYCATGCYLRMLTSQKSTRTKRLFSREQQPMMCCR